MEIYHDESLIKEIKENARSAMDYKIDFSNSQVLELVTNIVFEKSKQRYLSPTEKHEIICKVYNSICGLDVLQPLIDDEEITEIMINGPKNVFIEKHGHISKSGYYFESKERLEDVIQAIVSKVNRAVNQSVPIADARLSDGSRVNVVLSQIALDGPAMTIRKFPKESLTIKKLISIGTLSQEAALLLEKMVKAKFNVFISGGTGSGKTTFLNALSNFIPKDERIITIEDSAELQINWIENIVRMEVRNSNIEGKGEITIRDLIKTSLRMRPERIIVGEVRGPEALDMLQAMNTGHDGSISTGHANSSKDMLSRLETMVLCGANLPLEAIRQQIGSAIDIIIQIARLRDKTRKIVEICEVVGYKNGEIQMNSLYTFEDKGETEEGMVIGELKKTGNRIINNWKFKFAGIKIED